MAIGVWELVQLARGDGETVREGSTAGGGGRRAGRRGAAEVDCGAEASAMGSSEIGRAHV